MPNTSKNKKGFWNTVKRVLLIVVLLFIFVNIVIFITGKTYLYKGVQSTYLQGKTGPGIYDSVVFPVRTAHHDKTIQGFEESNERVNLSDRSTHFLKSIKTTSFLILKDEKIIHESYYGEHNQAMKSNSFSMAKSLIALMIGIAIDRGEISDFDASIHDYLPFDIPSTERVTIRHLLGMSSGLNWSESGSNPFSNNAVAYYTSHLDSYMRKVSFGKPPGDKFEYASGNSQLLGMILENATGKSATAYFEEHVWSKLGTKNDLLWSLDHSDGTEKTFCCAYATTRDYAKLGQLILNKGKYNDQSIISQENLAELTSPFNIKAPHYGLHFWLYDHPKYPAVYARGILGQYIIVIPSLNVVMVRTGHERKEKYFIPKKKKEDLTFVEKNRYKEYHPLDLFEYFSILDEVLEKH